MVGIKEKEFKKELQSMTFRQLVSALSKLHSSELKKLSCDVSEKDFGRKLDLIVLELCQRRVDGSKNFKELARKVV